MDIEFARAARQGTCAACVWYKPAVTVSGPQPYGSCQVAPPRASTQQQWPIVMADRWCSSWLPVSRFEEVH